MKTFMLLWTVVLYYKQLMNSRRSVVPAMWYDAEREMQSVVRYLNCPDDELDDFDQLVGHKLVSPAELSRLVSAWNSAGRNLARMLQIHSELHPYMFPNPLQGFVRVDGSGLVMIISPRSPIGDYRGVSPDDQAIDQARLVFMELLLNPQRERLSEKPCARCGRYYLKKTARQKVYCSRACSRDGTAAYATKKRLAAERQLKLQVAAEEVRNWAAARTKEDWKHWVCQTAAGRRVELTPKFLTRAVNKGELTEPMKGER